VTVSQDSWTVKGLLRERPALVMLGVAILVRLVYSLWAQFTPNDSVIYDELAHNLVTAGTYGTSANPLPDKSPGYPLLVALVYTVFGEHHAPVLVLQHALDIGTAVLVLAVVRAMDLDRKTALLSFGLALFNPFTMVYATMLLSETLATFLITCGTWLLLSTKEDDGRWPRRLALAGAVFSYAALTRPGFAPVPGLLLVALLLVRKMRFGTWVKWSGVAFAAFLVVWAPWVIRNAVRFDRFMPYHSAAGSPRPGYNQWAYNWTVSMLDIYGAWFEKPARLPPRAFLSADEKTEVEDLVARGATQPPPSADEAAQIDAEFLRLARARISAHPARYYVINPALRCGTMWFTREVTVLAQANVKTSDARAAIRTRPIALGAKVSLYLLAFLFPCFMIVGGVSLWRGGVKTIALPVATGMFTTLMIQVLMLTQPAFLIAMEPRYVIECFPTLMPLVATACFVFAGLAKRLRQRARALLPGKRLGTTPDGT
jgi:4-amino-4-deoxy-L-arabinose transferase-like glycosyltransferase